MSLGWLVAAVKIDPDKLTGTERAVLVGIAEATPKGMRRSRVTQDELMSIAGLKSRNGIDKVIKGLTGRGLVRHERARFGHAAAYELLFDEWVYDEADRQMRPPRVTHAAEVASPPGDPSPEIHDQFASPPGDATPELGHPQGQDASPGGDLSPEPRRATEKAAVGGESDQRGEGEPDPRVREILDAANLGPSWTPGIAAALDAGHTQAAIVHELTKPRKGARDIARVRWVALQDLAATRPAVTVRTATPEDPAKGEPEDLYADVAAEFGPARPVPDLPRLRRGQDPAPLAAAVSALGAATDPVGHATAVLAGTAPAVPAEHDPHTCMGCGKTMPTSRQPWVSRRTGKLVLYCLICTRKEG